jgi:uncharacterized membrane protein
MIGFRSVYALVGRKTVGANPTLRKLQPSVSRHARRSQAGDTIKKPTEKIMKTNLTMNIVTMTLLAALAVHVAAQDQQDQQRQHHHYKLIDMGTFRGPQSNLNVPDDSFARMLNNRGTLAGWADTAKPDPYPNFCFTDCYVSRAFQWQNGVRTKLSGLATGLSSATAWISPNGLIAGSSQNGQMDPLFPGFPEPSSCTCCWTMTATCPVSRSSPTAKPTS